MIVVGWLWRMLAPYNERWEPETGNDQLKTHLRGPGKVLRSKLLDLVHQEIHACLIVHQSDLRASGGITDSASLGVRPAAQLNLFPLAARFPWRETGYFRKRQGPMARSRPSASGRGLVKGRTLQA